MECPECGTELQFKGKTVSDVNKIPLETVRFEEYSCPNKECRYFRKGILYDPETKKFRPGVSSRD